MKTEMNTKEAKRHFLLHVGSRFFIYIFRVEMHVRESEKLSDFTPTQGRQMYWSALKSEEESI